MKDIFYVINCQKDQIFQCCFFFEILPSLDFADIFLGIGDYQKVGQPESRQCPSPCFLFRSHIASEGAFSYQEYARMIDFNSFEIRNLQPFVSVIFLFWFLFLQLQYEAERKADSHTCVTKHLSHNLSPYLRAQNLEQGKTPQGKSKRQISR